MSRERIVVIAGAGPVGLALANLIASAPGSERCRVHVVDPGAAPSWRHDEIDLRVYALSRASDALLERVGVWQSIRSARASPYRRMEIWERCAPLARQTLEFDSAEIGEPDLGHIVEDNLMRSVLWQQLETARNVECRWHHAVERIAIGSHGVDVTVGGERIAATLLVAADGARSAVRELVGIRVVERDYRQQALVTHIETGRPHRATAFQRFLPGGPLALLPLSDGRSSIVWSLPTATAERLVAADEGEFLTELQSASDDVLGTIARASTRAVWPLAARHAWRYCRQRVVLIGDAAHTVHPLAGLGMNLGLLDAAALAAVIEAAAARDEDIGDARVLRRYERQRKGDNLATLLALDGLDRLFRLPGGFAPLRGAGLGVVDRVPLAKRVLMQRALGLAHAGSRPR